MKGVAFRLQPSTAQLLPNMLAPNQLHFHRAIVHDSYLPSIPKRPTAIRAQQLPMQTPRIQLLSS